MDIIETNFNFKSLSYGNKPEFIVLHHAAINGSVEDINSVHLAKGWAGIGYHYYVRKDGYIYRGRPEKAVGAHCIGINSKSIGVCAEGNFENDIMSEAQKNSIIALCQDIKSRYNIKAIKRHKDFMATACPGKNYPFDEIISEKTIIEKINEVVDNMNIKDLQTFLNATGILNDVDGKPLKVDGDEGSRTKSAKAKLKEILGYILK